MLGFASAHADALIYAGTMLVIVVGLVALISVKYAAYFDFLIHPKDDSVGSKKGRLAAELKRAEAAHRQAIEKATQANAHEVALVEARGKVAHALLEACKDSAAQQAIAASLKFETLKGSPNFDAHVRVLHLEGLEKRGDSFFKELLKDPVVTALVAKEQLDLTNPTLLARVAELLHVPLEMVRAKVAPLAAAVSAARGPLEASTFGSLPAPEPARETTPPPQTETS